MAAIVGVVAYPATAKDARAPSNAWSQVGQATGGPAQAIGGTAHGCLAGAVTLPIDGVGYQVIHLSRRRNFGHGETVDFVERLGRDAETAGLPPFYVGDIAQPRGGPLPFGHASHQTGLDVDIWMTFGTKAILPPESREDIDLPSMLSKEGGIDPTRFGPRQVKLLQLAAAAANVDRIFVNPVIKLALCRRFASVTAQSTDWLHKLRPWWGHDDHFHVRLRCPEGSPACEPQAPVPDGDGCDAALEDWTHHLTPPKSNAPAAPHELSAACRTILDAK